MKKGPASLLLTACGLLLLSGCSSAVEKSQLSVSVVQETTDQTFEKDVLAAKEPVLVDFYATWCPPCKKVSPLVDELAQQFKGRVKVFKVDVDKNPLVSQAFSIQSIPTLVVFKGGQAITASTGAIPKSDLVALVEEGIAAPQVGAKDKSAPL